MNWVSLAIRAALGFAVLFLLGYIVPGFSGYTLTHLLIAGIVLGFLSTMAENVFFADNPRKESILLLAVSAVTIYFYSILFIRQRPPLVSTLLAAGLITVLSYVVEKRLLEEGTVQNGAPNPDHNQEHNHGE